MTMIHLAPGTLLNGGKYRIERFISSGGFGCTYEAEHTVLGMRVAIKEFFVKDYCNRNELSGSVEIGTRSKEAFVGKLKKKFIEEARILSQFRHSGIVHVADIFEENDTAYYVMDYIDGQSLYDMVNLCGHLDERRAVGYILQVADALEYVHDRNRLHLDIKPGNIMIGPDDRAILIDFGISKHYDAETGEVTSTLLGANTTGYAPQEQITQSMTTFNPATDIYALGATLYKLLTGVTPPNSVAIMADEAHLAPMPTTISVAVRNAVGLAMRSKRNERPQSIREFRALLLEGADAGPDSNAGSGSSFAGKDYGRTSSAGNASSAFSDKTYVGSLAETFAGSGKGRNNENVYQLNRLKSFVGRFKLPITVFVVLLFGVVVVYSLTRDTAVEPSVETIEFPEPVDGNSVFVENLRHNVWGSEGVYTGYTIGNVPNGYGVMAFDNGDKYWGDWKNGKMHGEGKYNYHDGNQYAGDWQDGQKNGRGTYFWRDKRRYVGEFRNGKFNGHGKIINPDGSVWNEGEWKNDRPVR